MILSFQNFTKSTQPFTHWVAHDFLPAAIVRLINKEWPQPDVTEGWMIEDKEYVKKRALLFPRRLPPTAQAIARLMYAPSTIESIRAMTGLLVMPDPWFLDGPVKPAVGGGLHEIYGGGLLNMHVDFNEHPSGMFRKMNLLIYLNEDWDSSWGGQLELSNADGSGSKTIVPYGGTTVIFETNGNSWHGHPNALATPPGRTRRSLALYYYSLQGEGGRKTTLYKHKPPR